ncbi:AraC family transcriptional regulator [Staphylococcus succinus]|uniref:AraC family transcriptional regulator n=1 Tax=Staphylococcus succinus TaxID=61015 RepID=UPI003F5C4F29
MYNEIIVEETKEELIQYPDKQWKHIILHTTLNKTLLGYIPLHWHNALQFIYVITGELDIAITDKTIKIIKGEGIFINSNVVHEIREHLPNTEYLCWNIDLPEATNYIEFSYVSRIVNNATHIPYIHLSSNNANHLELIQIIACAGKIYQQKQSHFKIDITIKYYELLKRLITILNEQNGHNNYYFDNRIKQLIEYIQEHFNSKITLKSLSQIIHMSKSETIKLFKHYVNQTPIQYLLTFRLEQSVSMLYNKQSYSITEVAMNCGFSTTSHFIQVFRKKYGITPKQFQKNTHLYNQ